MAPENNPQSTQPAPDVISPSRVPAALPGSDTLEPATPSRKRGKNMARRSGQTGTVVCKGRIGTVGITRTLQVKRSGSVCLCPCVQLAQ